MGFRVYPTLHCTECGEAVRLIAICEKPDSQTEARFYECANPLCRCTFKSCVPVISDRGWIGSWDEPESHVAKPH